MRNAVLLSLLLLLPLGALGQVLLKDGGGERAAAPSSVPARTSDASDRWPAERWLFSHPPHLRLWTLPNLEANPDQRRLITGVFCVFVEGKYEERNGVQWLPEVKAWTERLGLKFAYGVRHSHKSFEELRAPLDPNWQKAMVTRLKRTGIGDLMLDMEPYYKDKRRYHTSQEVPALFAAAREWRELGKVNLYIYPSGPQYWHGLAVARQAQMGGTRVFALDHTTYNPYGHDNLGQYMFLRNRFFEANELIYMPGFFLHVLKDEKVMREAARYGRCWFYADTSDGHADDLPHFGTPQWSPRSLSPQGSDEGRKVKTP